MPLDGSELSVAFTVTRNTGAQWYPDHIIALKLFVLRLCALFLMVKFR